MEILVSAFSNLSTDQRIEKVCRTLHNTGYKLTLIGNDWGDCTPLERPYPVERIHLKSKTLRGAYVEFNYKLYSKLRARISCDTVLHANDLDALLPNYLLSKKNKIPLLFDSHEIFTEMPAIQERWTQKVWRFLEKRTLPNLQYMMTESQSYANWFKEKYGVHSIVVRNIPFRIDSIPEFSKTDKKIILYQGAINPSRGLDKAIMAMKHLRNQNAILKIAGDGPKKSEYEKLAKNLGLEHCVHFAGRLLPQELRKLTQTANVGLSLEENGGVSYLYSLPNKVCDYIQARVPIVMINFPEMQRIHKDFKIGEMIDNHSPKIIAEHIDKVLDNGREHYLPELDRASKVFCWENEEPKILALYKKIIKDNFS